MRSSVRCRVGGKAADSSASATSASLAPSNSATGAGPPPSSQATIAASYAAVCAKAARASRRFVAADSEPAARNSSRTAG